MIKTFKIFSFVLIITYIKPADVNAQYGWLPQNSSTNNALSGVNFSSTDTGMVVGANGIILQTVNGGQNWSPVYSGVTDWLTGISFTNTNLGIIVGGSFGSSATVLITYNGGLTWTSIPVSPFMIYGIEYKDNIATRVGYLGSISRSIDNGQTWTPTPSGISPPPSQFNDVSFTNHNTGTVVGGSGTIARTIDGGTNWTQQTSGVTLGLGGVDFFNNDFGIIVGGNGLILWTTNAGTDWLPMVSSTTEYLSSVSLANSDTGYVVGNNGVILRTSDGGISWVHQYSGITNNLTDVFCLNGHEAYIVGDGGIVLYTNNGGEITLPPAAPILIAPNNRSQNVSISPVLSWSSSMTASEYNLQISEDSTFSTINIDTTVFADTSLRIIELSYRTKYFWRIRAQNIVGWSDWSAPVWQFITEDTSGTNAYWEQLTLPTSGVIDGMLWFWPDTILIKIDDKIYSSVDHCESWNFVSNNAQNITWGNGKLISKFGHQHMIACYRGGGGFDGPWIVQSSNFGVTWDTLLTFGYGSEINSIIEDSRFSPNRILLSGYDYFTNNGFILSASDTGEIDRIYLQDEIHPLFIEDAHYPRRTFAGGFGFVLRIDENFNNVEKFYIGDSTAYINHFSFRFGTLEYIASTHLNGIFKSCDGGETWIPVGLENHVINSLFVLDIEEPQYFYIAGTDSEGVFIYSHINPNWIQNNNGLNQFSIKAIYYDGYYIYVQTENQLYRHYQVIISSLENKHRNKDFKLLQNYPNPFNPKTNIQFSISKTEHVSLKIYNILGQKVATLVSEKLSAGQYNYEWNASEFASGIYFYKLETSGFVDRKKLFLIK